MKARLQEDKIGNCIVWWEGENQKLYLALFNGPCADERAEEYREFIQHKLDAPLFCVFCDLYPCVCLNSLECEDCGKPMDDSGYHLNAPGENWGGALHWFKPKGQPRCYVSLGVKQ